jgi:hypothetical protein
MDLTGTCWWGCSLWHHVVGAARSIGKWTTAHRTLVLSAFSLATMWMPPVSIAFGLAAAGSGAIDTYHDIRNHDYGSAVLDGIGAITGGFSAVASIVKGIRGGTAALEEFRASSRVGRSKAAKNAQTRAAKAGRQARRSERSWSRASNATNIASWTSTAAYFARRWVR